MSDAAEASGLPPPPPALQRQDSIPVDQRVADLARDLDAMVAAQIVPADVAAHLSAALSWAAGQERGARAALAERLGATLSQVVESRRTCAICFEDAPESRGILCERRCFFCGECFEGYAAERVQGAEGEHQELLRASEGRLHCPTLACDAAAFADADVARAVSAAAAAAYLDLRRALAASGARSTALAEAGALLASPDSQGADEEARRELLREQLRAEFGDNAYMCGGCGLGPVAHQKCNALATHHGERVGDTGVVNNACQRCGWWVNNISKWPRWDGRLPEDHRPPPGVPPDPVPVRQEAPQVAVPQLVAVEPVQRRGPRLRRGRHTPPPPVDDEPERELLRAVQAERRNLLRALDENPGDPQLAERRDHLDQLIAELQAGLRGNDPPRERLRALVAEMEAVQAVLALAPAPTARADLQADAVRARIADVDAQLVEMEAVVQAVQAEQQRLVIEDGRDGEIRRLDQQADAIGAEVQRLRAERNALAAEAAEREDAAAAEEAAAAAPEGDDGVARAEDTARAMARELADLDAALERAEAAGNDAVAAELRQRRTRVAFQNTESNEMVMDMRMAADRARMEGEERRRAVGERVGQLAALVRDQLERAEAEARDLEQAARAMTEQVEAERRRAEQEMQQQVAGLQQRHEALQHAHEEEGREPDPQQLEALRTEMEAVRQAEEYLVRRMRLVEEERQQLEEARQQVDQRTAVAEQTAREELEALVQQCGAQDRARVQEARQGARPVVLEEEDDELRFDVDDDDFTDDSDLDEDAGNYGPRQIVLENVVLEDDARFDVVLEQVPRATTPRGRAASPRNASTRVVWDADAFPPQRRRSRSPARSPGRRRSRSRSRSPGRRRSRSPQRRSRSRSPGRRRRSRSPGRRRSRSRSRSPQRRSRSPQRRSRSPQRRRSSTTTPVSDDDDFRTRRRVLIQAESIAAGAVDDVDEDWCAGDTRIVRKAQLDEFAQGLSSGPNFVQGFAGLEEHAIMRALEQAEEQQRQLVAEQQELERDLERAAGAAAARAESEDEEAELAAELDRLRAEKRGRRVQRKLARAGAVRAEPQPQPQPRSRSAARELSGRERAALHEEGQLLQAYGSALRAPRQLKLNELASLVPNDQPYLEATPNPTLSPRARAGMAAGRHNDVEESDTLPVTAAQLSVAYAEAVATAPTRPNLSAARDLDGRERAEMAREGRRMRKAQHRERVVVFDNHLDNHLAREEASMTTPRPSQQFLAPQSGSRVDTTPRRRVEFSLAPQSDTPTQHFLSPRSGSRVEVDEATQRERGQDARQRAEDALREQEARLVTQRAEHVNAEAQRLQERRRELESAHNDARLLKERARAEALQLRELQREQEALTAQLSVLSAERGAVASRLVAERAERADRAEAEAQRLRELQREAEALAEERAHTESLRQKEHVVMAHKLALQQESEALAAERARTESLVQEERGLKLRAMQQEKRLRAEQARAEAHLRELQSEQEVLTTQLSQAAEGLAGAAGAPSTRSPRSPRRS